jgi:hypothetical protein
VSSTAAESLEYEFSAGPPLVERPSRVGRARRAFTRYLIAICIGVAATLTWQSYGDTIKQTVATKAPGLGWSPEVQQLIAASVQQLGWTKPAELERRASPAAAPETAQQAPSAQAAADPAASEPSAVPSTTLEQMQQIASDVVALKQAITQLSSNQDQMALDIAKVQATDQEVLNKISANKVAANNKAAADKLSAAPAQSAAMPTHKYPPGSTTSSGPPLPRPLPLH